MRFYYTYVIVLVFPHIGGESDIGENDNRRRITAHRKLPTATRTGNDAPVRAQTPLQEAVHQGGSCVLHKTLGLLSLVSFDTTWSCSGSRVTSIHRQPLDHVTMGLHFALSC